MHRCFYLENVDNTKDRDGSVDNMVSLVKIMQEERFETQTEFQSKAMIVVVIAFLLLIVLLFLPKE